MLAPFWLSYIMVFRNARVLKLVYLKIMHRILAYCLEYQWLRNFEMIEKHIHMDLFIKTPLNHCILISSSCWMWSLELINSAEERSVPWLDLEGSRRIAEGFWRIVKGLMRHPCSNMPQRFVDWKISVSLLSRGKMNNRMEMFQHCTNNYINEISRISEWNNLCSSPFNLWIKIWLDTLVQEVTMPSYSSRSDTQGQGECRCAKVP